MALATEQSTTTELNQALAAIASFVESFEPGRYSGGDASELVGVFAKGERLCAAGKTLAARRAADANCHQGGGHRTPAHWLAEVTGEGLGEAIEVLSLGDSLATHPGMDSAYRGGKLSRSKAKAIAGAVRVNPEAEDELVATAEGDTARQNRERCQRAKAQGRSRQDAKARYDAIHRDRSCRTWTDTETGAFRLDARLTPDAGAALKAALQLESDRVFHRARRAGVKESPDAYAADALVALVTRDPARSTGQTSNDDQTSNDGQPGTKGSRGTRALVHVRVDLDALRTGVVGPGGICEIPGVGPIPVDRARELMGDALCELVITNGIDVTTITKMERAIPAALRRALDERDATCVVPGCDAVTGLEIDHRIVEVRDNGPTAMWNLAKLCSHHHDLRHHGGFTLAGGPGNWQWIPPGVDPDPPEPRTTATSPSVVIDTSAPGRPIEMAEPDRIGDRTHPKTAPRLFPKQA